MSSDQDAVKRVREDGPLAETSLELNPDEVTLECVLGDGSYGTVYKGVVRQNAVAIKVLDSTIFEAPGAQETFKREMEALSFIRHPNLCLFMGYTLSHEKPMVVNEFLATNLEVFLEDKEAGAAEKMKIAKEAALGLSWLHRNHIAHRELKPSNILLDANNHAKVSDYGLSRARLLINRAKIRQKSSSSASDGAMNPDLLTSTELACQLAVDLDELPYWTAPELLASMQIQKSTSLPSAVSSLSLSGSSSDPNGRISYEKCDIYSFGVILWQLVTRREPFSKAPGANGIGGPMYTELEEFVKAVVNDKVRPDIPNDTLPALQELIKDCWDANPNRRPPFQSIVKRLDHIMVDCAIRDPLANKFWKDTFLASGGEQVKWKEFCNSFATFLGLTVAGSLNVLDLITLNHHKIKDTTIPLDIRCLHAIMVQKDSHQPPPAVGAASTSSTLPNDDMVSMEHFGKMMDWFGPIRRDARALILTHIREVLQSPWFHGDIPTSETETRIMTREVGTFLVRFSNSAPGAFAISKVTAPLKVNHLRVSRDKEAQGVTLFRVGTHIKDTLNALVDAIAAEHGLLVPCANAPYAYLFAAQAPIGSYVDSNIPKANTEPSS